MNFALVLHDADRPEIVQLFGTYPTEQDADLALADLAEWRMLRGSWEILPIRAYPAPTAQSAPVVPYAPVAPTWTPPQPQWPYGQVIWCGGEQAPYAAPGWTGCAPAATTAYTIWTTGMTSSPRGEEPPDIAVPARI